MAVKKKFYITTAIDYVNASPHIGHAFEKVLADAISRWHKLQGQETWFLTGTDENAQKNAQAAKEEGIPTKQFVDKNSKLFIELCKKLNVQFKTNKFKFFLSFLFIGICFLFVIWILNVGILSFL